MLPMPGAPSTSWSSYRARIQAAIEGADLRVCIAFWLFGLINNIFYVIILSAALDLVGPAIPKATVLLASIIPSLATKIVVPYIIHLVPYSLRVLIFAALSTCGMLVVALSPSGADPTSVSSKIAGIVLANISSGAGEVNFLALTHFYGTQSLAAWGSGTGAAGLIGAGAYALATTIIGFSVHATLLASTVIPLGMLISFFGLLPLGPLRTTKAQNSKYTRLANDDEGMASNDNDNNIPEAASLLNQRHGRTSPAYDRRTASSTLRTQLLRTRALLIPYMLPLFLVYVAEYSINQGVSPALLFPLPSTPFTHFRAFYPTYSAIYQLGVFLSRSSLPFLRIKTLYTPTFLQVANLLALTLQALWPFIPSVYFVFGIVFWEGLLGGLVYVSTFAAIREEVAEAEREFCLGAVTVSDSAGICVAGLVGMVLERGLCEWQVRHGRGWCREL
ncbi:putative Golgi integral membrane protein [Hortaea werneckii]|nr:putative Golgi integral membrane protein [Hortaea werneckii]KAI7547662.1 putative Golgi integral membrane protein [Hortaea werneckii]KAI7596405.1 putative Golgi integral membrane protein [Hortaea werneckii]KAI7601490.1 putative Golgi integral membrane protein [Hortaea werneckii]KAI7700032.1 putative Golgi integral membrane protein [Hortaea werneckii]